MLSCHCQKRKRGLFMYIIKNAFRNIFQNAGRNIMIAAIFLLVITMSCIAIVIRDNTDAIAKEYKGQLSTQVFIEKDYNKISDKSNEDPDFTTPPITNEIVKKMASSKYLKKVEYSASLEAVADNLTFKEKVDKRYSELQRAGEAPEKARIPYMQISGYDNVANAKTFQNRQAQLNEGKFPGTANEALISDELAKLNNLKVGDTFQAKDIHDQGMNGKQLKEMTFKISGIYHNSNTDTYSEVFTKTDYLINEDYAYKPLLQGTYYLSNPKDLDNFKKEAYASGLSEYYSVKTDDVAYNAFIKPIEQMSTIATIFLGVVLVLGATILLLLSMLAIRERKYEIGVLRAMGMKKSSIIIQMLLESAMIMIVCLAIGLLIGSLLAQPITDFMLADKLASQGLNTGLSQNIGNAMNGSLATDNAPITHINAILSITSIAQLSGVGLLLVLLASLVSSFYAMKFEPMRILRERN